MMKPIRMIKLLGAAAVVAVALTSLAASPASAQGKGKGKSWGHGEFCPPGLAKKGCVPPGQRKKYQVGHTLPYETRYRTIYEYERYNLAPPPDGHFYGYVDNDVLLIRAATRLVVDAVVLGILLN